MRRSGVLVKTVTVEDYRVAAIASTGDIKQINLRELCFWKCYDERMKNLAIVKEGKKRKMIVGKNHSALGNG